MALRRLAVPGFVSAGIISRSELTTEIAGMAMSALRGERAAQATIMSILGGTCFKAYFHGVLVPARSPRMKRRGVCEEEDSYEHLVGSRAASEKDRSREGLSLGDGVSLGDGKEGRSPGSRHSAADVCPSGAGC